MFCLKVFLMFSTKTSALCCPWCERQWYWQTASLSCGSSSSFPAHRDLSLSIFFGTNLSENTINLHPKLSSVFNGVQRYISCSRANRQKLFNTCFIETFLGLILEIVTTLALWDVQSLPINRTYHWSSLYLLYMPGVQLTAQYIFAIFDKSCPLKLLYLV